MFAIFERFIYSDEKFLSSIEYRRFSTGFGHFSGEIISSIRRSSSSVRVLVGFDLRKDVFVRSRERKPDRVWYFNPPKAYQITESDITDFVNCVKECAFISVFNKAHFQEAAKACQCLSQLRPELIVPPLVELFVFFQLRQLVMIYCIPRLFSSVDSMTEPHRFTSIITCLAGMTRQIVQQTPRFSQGQTYVLPLLMAVLPGIDSNDFKKTAVTFQFLNAILMLITCVDCSSAVNTRNDLTEVRYNLWKRQ